MHERHHNSVAPFSARYDRWLRAAARRRRRRHARTAMKIAGGVCVGVSLLLVPIIAVISGLGYEQSDAARNQAYEVAKCIDIFRSQHGRWPHDLDELVTPPRPHKAIMEALPRDPWGNAYLYFAPGWRNVDKVDVMSRGEDGIAFTDDDLGNWHD